MGEREVEKKKTCLSIAVISFLFMLVMVVCSNSRSLWMDDLAQIQIVSKSSLVEMLKENMVVDNNPPLSHFLSYVWIRLVPYGTGWLKLMNIILITCGTFICGLVAYKGWGKWAGLATTFLCASNMAIVSLAAYTFRPYGLLFFASALMTFWYVRSREIFSWKTNMIYMLTMLLAVYTHYFAILVCIAFFLCDVVLIIRKRMQLQFLLIYPLTAIGLSPWLMCVIYNSIDRLKSFWPAKPDFNMLCKVLCELAGYDDFFVLLICICFGSLVIKLLCQLLGKKSASKEKFFSIALMSVPMFVISSVYVASKYMTSITSLFVSRYFVSVMPQIFVLAGVGLGTLIEYLCVFLKNKRIEQGTTFAILLLLICLIGKNGVRLYSTEHVLREPFEETADFLIEQENIRDGQTLIFNTCYGFQEGWDYYLTHKGKREGIGVTWYNLSEESLEGIKCVYAVVLHLQMRDEDIKLLENNGFELVEQHSILPIQIYERE